MKSKLLHYSKEIVIFIIVMTILANIISFYKSGDLNKEKLININSFLIDGKTFKSDSVEPLLVHIWATWCPTCKLEASNIDYISKEYDVITIAVKSGSDEDIKNYLDENGYTFKVINDMDGYYSRQFNISAYPTTLVYDKDKNLVFSDVGYTSTIGLYFRMWWAGL